MRRLIIAALFIAGWTVLAMLFALQTGTAAAYAGVRLSARQAISIALVAWYLRALLVPLGFSLATRLPWRNASPGRVARNLALHAAVSLLAAAGLQVAYALLMTQLTWIPRRATFNIELPMNVLTYWASVAAAHGIEFYNRARDHELAASQLQGELAGARLDAICAQFVVLKRHV